MREFPDTKRGDPGTEGPGAVTPRVGGLLRGRRFSASADWLDNCTACSQP